MKKTIIVELGGYLIVTSDLKNQELQRRVEAGEKLHKVIKDMFYISK